MTASGSGHHSQHSGYRRDQGTDPRRLVGNTRAGDDRGEWGFGRGRRWLWPMVGMVLRGTREEGEGLWTSSLDWGFLRRGNEGERGSDLLEFEQRPTMMVRPWEMKESSLR